MAQCPVCQSEIEITNQHYGTLYTCPRCNAVFFVDWNGQPEAASPVAEESPMDSSPTSFSNNEDFQPQELGNFDSLPYEQTAIPHEEEPAMEPPMPPPMDGATSEGYSSEPAEEEAYDFAQPLGEMTPQPMSPLGAEPREMNLSDIADFGNADLSQSAFNYTVIISGIDSGAIRSQIQEALTDSKFGWNVQQTMTQIKGGVLTLTSVNAVKASILIQRVKYLPVKISWRQDVLSSSV